MNKKLMPLLLGLWALAASGQIVTTRPAIVQTDSKNIVITYHADEGNKGLAGLASSAKVYAHTGVITSESSGPSDWKHAPTWLDNSAKYEMTYAGPDTWTLTIPDIKSYYGLSDGETVEKLMFVFRNATGSQEGKTAQGGDIAVDVYPAGFQVVLTSSLESSVVNSPDPVTFTVNTTASANIRLYIDGQPATTIASGNATQTLTGSRAFTAIGSYNIIAEATPTAGGESKQAKLTLVKLGESVRQDYPGGIPQMGAVENSDGTVTFCIAAPGKNSMVLVPSWRDYQVTADLQMKYQDYDGNRYFWTTVSGLKKDSDYIYYYLADGVRGVGDPYARLVLDPWSDKYIADGVFPDMPQYPVGSVPEGLPLAVYNSGADTYQWQVPDFKGVDKSRLVIYELLIRDFTGTEGEANGEGTVNGVISKLDYLQGLGINAIELLPIMEFNGNNSWGYNTNFYFAPDKAYGSPDDYRRLIDECHSRGIAVILDIVFNQSDGLHPWYQLYDIADNPFYNGTAPHAYSVLNDWKQENPLVEKQWTDALTYWLTAYNVDGFRFDLVKGLGDSDSYGATYNASENTWSGVTDARTNDYNQSRIDRMKRLHAAMKAVKPDAYFINEDLAGAEEENAMAEDGQMNWANLNNASTQYELGISGGANLNRFYAPEDSRLWGSTVSYMESHDEERIAYAMQQSTASTATTIKRTDGLWQLRLGSIAAQMLMAPGPHMIWQFQEFAADQTTKNSSGNDTSPKKMVWSYLDNEYNAGLKDTYARLIALRNSNPEMFADSLLTSDNCNFELGTGLKTIVITNGDKQLVLAVNSNANNYSRSLDLSGVATHDASAYVLLASSHGTTPVMTDAKKVSLRGCCFAVFGTDNLAGIDDIISDGAKPDHDVYFNANGDVCVDGQYHTLTVYDIASRRLPSTGLSNGIYIVKVDNKTYKLALER